MILKILIILFIAYCFVCFLIVHTTLFCDKKSRKSLSRLSESFHDENRGGFMLPSEYKKLLQIREVIDRQLARIEDD
jgi:hypothetical protein